LCAAITDYIRQTYSNENEMNVTNVAVTDDVQSCDRKSGAELNVATEPSQIPQPKKKLNQERLVSDNSKDGSVKTTEVTAGPKKNAHSSIFKVEPCAGAWGPLPCQCKTNSLP